MTTNTEIDHKIRKYECRGHIVSWNDYDEKGRLTATHGVRFEYGHCDEAFEFAN